MGTARRIAKNAAVTFFGDNLLKVLSTVLVILIARYLGDVDYGKFTFALSFTGLFLVLMDLGTRILIVRDIIQNKDKAPKIVANVLLLKVVSTTVVYFLMLAIAYFLSYDHNTMVALAIAGAGLIFDSLAATVGSIFQAYERLEFGVMARITRILLRFAVTVPLLLMGVSFIWILVIYAVVHFINFVMVLAICYKKFVALNFDFDKNMIVSILKRSFPFWLSGIFVTVYFRIDITLMSKLAPTALAGVYSAVSRDAVIGWYSSAYNLLDAAAAIAGAVSAAILPVAVAYFRDSREKLMKLYSLAARYLVFIAVPTAVGTTLLADKIIVLLYKAEYANASLALQILIWTMVPLCINYMMGAMMIASHQEKKGVYVLMLNAVVNILLNLYLIPRYSLYGAAVATVLTEIFYFAGYYFIISRSVGHLDFVKMFVKPVVASAVMGLVIFKFMGGLPVVVAIIASMIIYGAAMFLMKALEEEDIALIRKIFIRKEI
ncbi:MAG: polysaccharide biosynthesis protein [archaeon GW2011_AR3]|nr:MAG: polysaccharide biosynthesis protein [archaeon GW2011_AR3]MBS3109973.1 flippase [Candidatus Woesearchaeota archaeon]